MTINVMFTFLKPVDHGNGMWETWIWDMFHVWEIREKTIEIMQTAAFRNFHIKNIKPSCYFNATFNFMKSRYQRENQWE